MSRKRITIKVPMESRKARRQPTRWALFEQKRSCIRAKRREVHSEMAESSIFDCHIWRRFLIVTNSLGITNIPLPREELLEPYTLALNADGTVKFRKNSRPIWKMNPPFKNPYFEYTIELAKKNLSKLDANPAKKQKI